MSRSVNDVQRRYTALLSALPQRSYDVIRPVMLSDGGKIEHVAGLVTDSAAALPSNQAASGSV